MEGSPRKPSGKSGPCGVSLPEQLEKTLMTAGVSLEQVCYTKEQIEVIVQCLACTALGDKYLVGFNHS